MRAIDLDKAFDDGDDGLESFDWTKARRANLEPCRVNVDFPARMVEALDREAAGLGVARPSLIKLCFSERLGKAA